MPRKSIRLKRLSQSCAKRMCCWRRDRRGADIARVLGVRRQLWYQRNRMFKAAGYCFHTPLAIRFFGNAGCSHDSQYELPLSDRDRQGEIHETRICGNVFAAGDSASSGGRSHALKACGRLVHGRCYRSA